MVNTDNGKNPITLDDLASMVAEGFNDITSRMATKDDIANMATKDDIAQLRLEMAEMKTELKTELKAYATL